MTRKAILTILVLLAVASTTWATGDVKPPPGYAVESISYGPANRGVLINGIPFPPGTGYRLTSKKVESYAVPETVEAILYAIGKVREKYPDAADLVLGDLSYPKGGKMSHHRSHRSGRDADIGMYLKGNRETDRFIPMSRANIDIPKTWRLIEALIEDNKVEVLFLATDLERMFYQYAKDDLHYSTADLERIFHVAGGRRDALIRYARGHKNHLHARFRCPRAVAAAAKYAAAEIHRMRSIQPEGGFVAVAGRPAEDGSTRSDVRLVSNSGPRFKVIENPGFVRPTAVSRIGHVVGASETLSAVARAYGLAVEQVRTWNALGEGDDVHAGQRLVLYVDRTLGGSRADGVFVAAEGFTPATEGADAADQWVDVPLTDFGTFVVPASTPRPATTPAN